MARLNLKHAVTQGKKIMNNSYAMCVSDFCTLCEKDEYDAITDAFAYGYYQGAKATKAEMKKKARAAV